LQVPEGYKVAVFANGCFWGSEKGIWRLPAGIHSTAVGYCAGFTPNPTYEEVSIMLFRTSEDCNPLDPGISHLNPSLISCS